MRALKQFHFFFQPTNMCSHIVAFSGGANVWNSYAFFYPPRNEQKTAVARRTTGLKHSYKQGGFVRWQNYELHGQWAMEVADISVRSAAPRGRFQLHKYVYAPGNYTCRCAIDINMHVNILRPMLAVNY